jgi:two-component system nitrogen regulation sensor histidine kinase GlnL
MYKRILDNLNTAILLFDSELRLTFINPTGEILLADSSYHLVGQSADELFKYSDPAMLNNIKQSLTMAEPLIDRALTLSRTSHNVTINFSATPLVVKYWLSFSRLIITCEYRKKSNY